MPRAASAGVRLWVELSGEHPTLPRAEALAALEAESCRVARARWSTKVLRVDADGPADRALGRLGLAHVVCEEVAAGDLDAVREAARSTDLRGQAFRIRARPLAEGVYAKDVEAALGADLARSGTVDLTSPAVDFRVLVGEEVLLGRVLHRIERSAMEGRKVTYRPFSLPISLHPRLARALVNLSRVPSGGAVLDPFCGTGGILLEASRLGLRAVGGDLRWSMILGARRSLESLGAAADLVVADAGRGPWRPTGVRGIATDPPYGRAASTHREKPADLYGRAFAAFREVLPAGGYAAAVLPNEGAVDVAARHLELVERHDLRVHRSLTRIFCAFVRRS